MKISSPNRYHFCHLFVKMRTEAWQKRKISNRIRKTGGASHTDRSWQRKTDASNTHLADEENVELVTFASSAEEGNLQESKTGNSPQTNTEFCDQSQKSFERSSSQRLRTDKPPTHYGALCYC